MQGLSREACSPHSVLALHSLSAYFQWAPRRRRKIPLTTVSIAMLAEMRTCVPWGAEAVVPPLNLAETGLSVSSHRLPKPEDRRAGVCRGPVHRWHPAYPQ